MAILKIFISGEVKLVVLSDLAKGRARDKLEERRRALQGQVLYRNLKKLQVKK